MTLIMSDTETNGNAVTELKGPSAKSGSVEDVSEYTDADDSISAPTEILAEFLSAIMLKDYETALNYCKLILHYEPNNSTAKEFYPLIAAKIELRTKMPWEVPRVVEGNWAEACRKFERLPNPLPELHYDPPMSYYNNVKTYASFVPYDLFYNFEEGYDSRAAREDRKSILPKMENIFKEEENKYIPVTSQLWYGRPLLLQNVLDWSGRLARSNVTKDFYVHADDSDEDSSDSSDSMESTNSNHSFSSGTESEHRATESEATSASYSSLEDEEADAIDNVREMDSISLSAKDIVNGNATIDSEINNVVNGILKFSVTVNGEKRADHQRLEDVKRKASSVAAKCKQITKLPNDSFTLNVNNSHSPNISEKINLNEKVSGL